MRLVKYMTQILNTKQSGSFYDVSNICCQNHLYYLNMFLYVISYDHSTIIPVLDLNYMGESELEGAMLNLKYNTCKK